MPIKFRCQHCQQLLGISRSQAGVVVDCPGCGRSLRVPDLDGRTRKVPDAKATVKQDSGLLNALTALSELNENEFVDTLESAQPDKGGVITLAPVTSADPVDVEISQPQPVVEAEHAETPIAIRESLEELADFEAETIASNATIADAADIPGASGRWPAMAALTGALALLLVGFLAGRMTSGTPDSQANAEEVRHDAKPIADTNKAEQPSKATQTKTITGTVAYTDATGQQQADAGALVLLLPETNAGSVRWNARSLRKTADHPDRVATIAALRAIGADVTVCDEEGRFQLSGSTNEEAMVVVVSRFHERAEDLPVDERISQLLAAYFDSTSHICGRLDVRMKRAETTAALPFQF